jgi:hypothetical protein
MRQHRVALALCAAAVLLAAGSLLAQGGPAPAPHPQPHEDQWEPTISSEAHFTVLMPGQPKFETRKSRSSTGRPITISSYLLDLGPRAYMVMYSDYEDENISLDNAVEGIVKGLPNGRIASDRKGVLFGHDARFVELEAGEMRMRYRLFVRGTRLYQIAAIATRAEFPNAHIEGFLDSFKLSR